MGKSTRAPRTKKADATAPEKTLTDLKKEAVTETFTPSPSLNYPHREESPASLTHHR